MGMAFVTMAKPAGYPVVAEKGQAACISAESTAPSSVPETPPPRHLHPRCPTPSTCNPNTQHPPIYIPNTQHSQL